MVCLILSVFNLDVITCTLVRDRLGGVLPPRWSVGGELLGFSATTVFLITTNILCCLVISFANFTVPYMFQGVAKLCYPNYNIAKVLARVLELSFGNTFRYGRILFMVSPFVLCLLKGVLCNCVECNELALGGFSAILAFILVKVLLIFKIIEGLPPFSFLEPCKWSIGGFLGVEGPQAFLYSKVIIVVLEGCRGFSALGRQ